MKRLLFILVLAFVSNAFALEAVEPKKVIILEDENCLVKEKEEGKCYDFLFSYDKSGIEFIDEVLLKSLLAIGVVEDDENKLNNAEPKSEEEVKNIISPMLEKIKENLQKEEGNWGTSITINADFLNQRGKFVQYKIFNDEYAAGAAHGLAYDSYIIFDLSSYKMLHLKDMLEENKESVFIKLLEKGLGNYFLDNNYYHISEDYQKCLNDEATMHQCLIENLAFETHPFKIENLSEIADNFYFSADGINFNFPPYAIAPYAFGSLEAKIKWKDLKGIIKDEYLP